MLRSGVPNIRRPLYVHFVQYFPTFKMIPYLYITMMHTVRMLLKVRPDPFMWRQCCHFSKITLKERAPPVRQKLLKLLKSSTPNGFNGLSKLKMLLSASKMHPSRGQFYSYRNCTLFDLIFMSDVYDKLLLLHCIKCKSYHAAPLN